MSVPTTFKAAVIPEAGGQHHILTDRELAPLAPGEVAIKITATAINPVDWKLRDNPNYRVYYKTYPAVSGSDAAGTVAALGPGVTSLAVGDRVFFQGIIGTYDSSTFQQYCKMPAALLVKTPASISDEQAAGVALATVAALVGFYHESGHGVAPPPWEAGGEKSGIGKAVVVLGGSSSVGQYAIQLAKLSGFERIITNASARHVDFVKSLGADVVLDRAVHGSAEDFKAAVGDLPLTFVFDAVSEKDTQLLGVKILQTTKTEGSHVIIVQNINAEAKELGQAQEPKVDIQFVMGVSWAENKRSLSEPFYESLGGENGYIAKGKFVPNRPVVVPGGLGALDTALDKNKKGVSGEKVVIRPFDV